MGLDGMLRKANAGDVEAMLALTSYYNEQRQVNEAVEWADKAAAQNNVDGMYRAAILHNYRLSLVLKGGKPFWGFLKEDAQEAQKNAAVLIGLCNKEVIHLEEEVISELMSVLKDGIYCEAVTCYMEDAHDYQQAVHLLKGIDSPRERALYGLCQYELGQTEKGCVILNDILEDQVYAREEKLPAEEVIYSIAVMVCSGMERQNGSLEKALVILSRGMEGVRDVELKNEIQKEKGRYKKKLFGGWKYD